eukprot:978510-Lingulodinium_polyedra.AAC.1
MQCTGFNQEHTNGIAASLAQAKRPLGPQQRVAGPPAASVPQVGCGRLVWHANTTGCHAHS